MRYSFLVTLTAAALTACAHRYPVGIEEPVADSASYVWSIRAYHTGDLWLRVGDSLDVVLLRDICIPRLNGCWPREDSTVAVRWDIIGGDGVTVTPLPRGEWTFGPGSSGVRLRGAGAGAFQLRARLRHQSMAEPVFVASRGDTTHRVAALLLTRQFGPAWCREQMAPLLRAARERQERGDMASDSIWVRELTTIYDCLDEGLPAVIAYWRAPYGDSLQTGSLKGVTSMILDARLFPVVMAVAADTTLALRRRVDALHAIGPWMGGKCWIGITYPLTLPKGIPDRALMSAGSNSHSGLTVGMSLSFSPRDSILSLLTRLAASDPSSVMRRLAGEAQSYLRSCAAPGP
jgi:hypothetical protein